MKTPTLVEIDQLTLPYPEVARNRYEWFTPLWAAEALVERFFPHLSKADLLCEPSAGAGSFLQVIPEEIPAFGVEINPELASRARTNSGREVICGDFRSCKLPEGISVIIGNPPFSVPIIEGFLARSKSLPELRECGLLLPAYAMQTHKRVVRWLDHWSIRCEVLPRRLFPRLRLPLVFTLFKRGASREMIGLCLFTEAVEFDNLSGIAKKLLIDGRPRRGVWQALVEEVLRALGGTASLREIYHAVQPRRPTGNEFWKEKVRQTLQRIARPVERGVWSLSDQQAIVSL